MTAGRNALEDESGVFLVDIIPLWLSRLIYHVGDKNRPVGGGSSEM
jgi:hypothetical protein